MNSKNKEEEMYKIARNIWNDQNFMKTMMVDIQEKTITQGKEEEDAQFLYERLEMAAHDPDTNDYDALILTSALHLRDNHRLPAFLSTFVADVLEGKRQKPIKRGVDKYKNFERNGKIRHIIEILNKELGLPKYNNNELNNKTTAADIAVEISGLSLNTIINIIKG
ncbi:MAG: hypothetical protein O2916_09315 [Proteobacteria bacterium]|nr:hypothetical protein [Pseudomonadota bacterium]